MSESAELSRKTKGRSPSYPGVNLEVAVQRARQLYSKERQHSTAVGTIAVHWGYKSLNGPGAVTLAALKKFGLVVDDGTGADRRANLTDLAVDILENPSMIARHAATQKAALNPSIHQELWSKYGASLPSDLNLRWELTRERGFTETGADEFIREYHDTVKFADLIAEGADSHAQGPTSEENFESENPRDAAQTEDTPEDRTDRRPEAAHPAEPGTPKMSLTTSAYTIPLPRGAGQIRLEAKFPLTEAEWQYFMTLLGAMKAGLVDNGQSNG